MADGLEDRLKKALAGRKEIDLSSFQFVSLEMVKVGSGDQWIPLRKKIYQVAVHFVEKRLHPDDVLVRCRGGFILIFANLSGYHARERAADLSEALNVFFLGDEILKDLDIRSGSRTVNAEDLSNFIQATKSETGARDVEPERRSSKREDDPARMSGAAWSDLDQGGSSEMSASGREMTPGSRGPDGNWSAQENRQNVQGGNWTEQDERKAAKSGNWSEQEARQKRDRNWSAAQQDSEQADMATPATDGWGDDESADGGGAAPAGTGSNQPEPQREFHIEQHGRVEQKPNSGRADAPPDRKLDAKPSKAAQLGLVDAVFSDGNAHWDDIVFKPCWDAKNAIIANNFCLPRRFAHGKVFYGRDTLMGAGSKDVHRTLDHAVAVAAQRGFQTLFHEGAKCAIAIPVHYDTISAVSDRVSYFSILQAVPQHLRRYFFLRVDAIPPGAPLSQMQELFRSMGCFGSNVLANIRFGTTDLSAFEGCNIGLFGSETPASAMREDAQDMDVAALAAQCKAAKALSAQSYLTQVPNFEILSAAVTAGVRYHAGLAIGEESALPVPVKPCSFNDLYARGMRIKSATESPQKKAG